MPLRTAVFGCSLTTSSPTTKVSEKELDYRRELTQHAILDPNQMMERISKVFQHVAELEQRMMTEREPHGAMN